MRLLPGRPLLDKFTVERMFLAYEGSGGTPSSPKINFHLNCAASWAT